MYNLSLTYNPDHQQVLERHQELLKQAEQKRSICEALETQKAEHSTTRIPGFLRHLFVRRRTRNLAGTVSHPGVQP